MATRVESVKPADANRTRVSVSVSLREVLSSLREEPVKGHGISGAVFYGGWPLEVSERPVDV